MSSSERSGDEAVSENTVKRTTGGWGSGRGALALGAALLFLGITLGHYLTDPHHETLHHLYRRLYYLPVVLMAFASGWRGGLGAALLVGISYAPHAFLMSHHRDPAPVFDKLAELLLYVLVGLLSGALLDRERRAQGALLKALEEREALEAGLVRAAKMSALGHLLAGVSHELRNPLASILGTTDGLERQLNRPTAEREEAQERASRLITLQRKELNRLERVLSRYLAFARTRPPERSWVRLDQLIQRVIELVEHQELSGRFERDERLTGLKVWVDEDQLTQVLLNLTLNAIEAQVSPESSEGFTVSYRLRGPLSAEGELCFGVIDRGPGPSEALYESLFEPFFTTKSEGTGLGLSVSRQLIEAHGGELSMSREGDETGLWLRLPQATREERER